MMKTMMPQPFNANFHPHDLPHHQQPYQHYPHSQQRQMQQPRPNHHHHQQNTNNQMNYNNYNHYPTNNHDGYVMKSTGNGNKTNHHNNNHHNHNKNNKAKQVLPCFNLVCTGTCAYGPKCTFLHDPRAQLPKPLRKQAEFLLQSHLHTFRPNKKGEEDHVAHEVENNNPVHNMSNQELVDFLLARPNSPTCVSNLAHCDSSSVDSNEHKPLQAKSAAFKRDDIFDYPTMAMQYNEPNAKCYDPVDDSAFLFHAREMSMWYNMLDIVNDKQGFYSHDKPMMSSRLPVFVDLCETH